MRGIVLSASLAFTALAVASPNLPGEQHRAQFAADQPSVAPIAAEPSGVQQPQSLQDRIGSAQAGDMVAQNNLGYDYAFGNGIPQSRKDAVKWLTAAASTGFVPAEVNLGLLYEKGWAGKVDLAEAARWLRVAAEQGDALTECKLGNIYEFARGVPQDYTQAAEWYRKAALQGPAAAPNHLGSLYPHG